MVSLSAKNIIANSSNLYPVNYPKLPFQVPRVRFKISSKKSNLEDFQTYAKPSRLLAATEVKIFSESLEQKIFSDNKVDEPSSFYMLNLRTSNSYGSALTDINAGLLICLIDENNDSILQRIPASSIEDPVRKSEESPSFERIHFQRGSVDGFIFSGPMLPKIKAIWIGVESGQWRLGGLSLSVVSPRLTSAESATEKRKSCQGLQYDFEVDDILLGDGSENSMVELKPCQITELSGIDPSTILKEDLQYPSLENQAMSIEESMKEYTDLKFSLLLYDALLISTGTSIAEFSSGDGTAFAFLFGGVCGFLYLLLLQRSVDELPAPGSTPSLTDRNFQEMFTGFKSPVTGLVLAIGISVLALKYGSRDIPLDLSPKDVIAGMMGFLACKVAVVLAAFKPVPLDRKMFK